MSGWDDTAGTSVAWRRTSAVLATFVLLALAVSHGDATQAQPPPPPMTFSLDAPSIPRGPKTGLPQLDTPLNDLLATWTTDRAGALQRAEQRNLKIEDERVHVTILMLDEKAAPEALTAIPLLGGEVTAHYKTAIDAWVPVKQLATLSRIPRVSLIHQPIPPMPLNGMPSVPALPGSGTFVTQGVAASNADAWQLEGLLGAGVSVAVIDSFQDAAGAQAVGELPTPVFCYPNCASLDVSSPHGTACAEIIHDMAPAATLTLSSASTSTEFAQRVVDLAALGHGVISVSMGFADAVPGDGSGTMASAIQTARATYGTNVVISAGNNAEFHWDGLFTDANGNSVHEFPGGAELNFLDSATGYPAGHVITAYLRWSDWPTSDQDFDLYLLYWDPILAQWFVAAAAEAAQTGTQPPFEFLAATAPFSGLYSLAIVKWSATTTPVMDLMGWNRHTLEIGEVARSVTDPASSLDALAVAAVDVNSPFPLESYSSRGPLHGPGGTLSGGYQQPRLAAFANVDTWSYGPGVFAGTSSAAPHIAGATALIRGAQPAWTPGQVQSFLEDRAIDQGPAGWDSSFGMGRLWLGCPIPPPPVLSAPSSAVSGADYSVSWTATSPDSQYELQESLRSDFLSALTSRVDSTSKTFNHTVTTTTTYYYRSRAVDECSGGDSYSLWSNVDQTTVQPPTLTLSVTKLGSGAGTVSSSPTGINCGSTCSASFPFGQLVTLTATAGSGSAFAGWSGDCSGYSTTCPLTLISDVTAKAMFQPAACVVTLDNHQVTASETHESCYMLIGGPSLEVMSTGQLTLRAVDRVILVDGVSVEDNGILTVETGAFSGLPATGTITTVAAADLVDGETFTLNDRFAAQTFEFEKAGNGVSPGSTPIIIGGSANDVRDAIAVAVNASGILITASIGGAAIVDLISDQTGVIGNQPITETVADPGFVVQGMSGGMDPIP